MVRRRDEYVVSGDIERNTGSSLYSRETMTHMSMPVRLIKAGISVSNRFWIQPLTSGACSRCVSTRCAGSGYDGACALLTTVAAAIAAIVKNRRKPFLSIGEECT